MLGLVLWSDPEADKAVFWCEDQGDLAFYQGTGADFGDREFFEAGDMVQFSVAIENHVRRAQNPRLIRQKACQDLQRNLRDQTTPASGSAKVSKIAQVVPFRRRKAQGRAPAMKA
jgi:hypothetical protein